MSDEPDEDLVSDEEAEESKRTVFGVLRSLVLRLAALVVVLAALLLLGVFALLRSETFARYVIERALPAVDAALPGTIAVGSYGGGLGSRFELLDVTIADEHGDVFISADRLALEWEVFDLVFKDVSVSRLELERPVFTLRQREDGTLNVVTAFVKPGPPKPKPERKGPRDALIPLDIEVGEVVLTNGSFVFEKADGTRIVDVQSIDLDAGYTLRGWEHDIAIEDLGAKLDAPIEIPIARLSGGARMYGEEMVLDLDQAVVSWKDDVIGVDGSIGSVKNLLFDAKLDVRRFDLLDVKEFAASAPLRGEVTGPLKLTGPLSDLHLGGELMTREGGKLDIADLGVRVGKPLGHHADITMTEFALDEVLDVPQLPPALTGRVTWDGEGTGLDTLKGAVGAHLGVIDYQQMDLGPTDLSATVAGGKVDIAKLAVGLAGGTPTVVGAIDLLERCFDVRVGGGVAALQDLRRRIPAPITRGSVRLDATAVGCWSTESDLVALRTSGKADIGNLSLTAAETSVKDADLGWTLDVAIPKAPTGPLLSGPVTLEFTGGSAAKQVIDDASLRGTLSNTRFTIDDLTAGSGPDLGLDLAGHVDWGAMPTLAIHGERLRATYRSVSLETPQPFDFRLASGAVEASGLIADADEGGKLILQGSMDPKGDTNALLRVLTFDLVQTDAFLPEDGKLSGVLEDFTVKLSGPSRSPAVSVRTRLRQFAAAGRGPIDVDLDLTLDQAVLSGSMQVDELLAVELGRFPLEVRLDGKGGLPLWIPAEAEVDGTITLLDGELSRFERSLGVRIPPNYTGGRVRGSIQLGGVTSNPTAGGAFILNDLLVDLQQMEAKAGSQASEDAAQNSREVSVQAAYELADGVFTLRDTRLKTVKEGRVLEAGARALVPVGDYLMAVAGPRELRTVERPNLLSGLEVEAALKRLPMTLLHLLSPVTKPVSGALEGTLVVAGSLGEPEVRADIQLLGGRVSDRALKRVELDAAVAGGRMTAQLELVPDLRVDDDEEEGRGAAKKKARKTRDAVAEAESAGSAAKKARSLLAETPDAGRLHVQAQAPLPLTFDGSRTVQEMLGQPGLRGEVRADAFPLPILLAFLPGSMDPEGSIQLTGTVGGTLLDPQPDVRLTLDKGRFGYQRTSVSYEDISLDVALTPEAIEVRKASLDTLPLIRNPLDLVFKPNVSKDTRQTGRRSLDIRGRIVRDGWRPGEFDLSVAARGLWAIYTQEIKAQLGGDLTVAGVWPDISVKGVLDVDEVNVDMGQESFGRRVLSMELPENLTVHRTEKGQEVRATFQPVILDDGTGLLDNYDADVKVRLGNKVRVKLAMGIARGREDALRALNMIGSIEPEVNIGGEVQVQVTNGKPSLVGQIEVTRDSRLTALTKKFLIRPGSSVILTGDVLDSRLDLTADYPSNYGSIQVLVKGSLAEPQIEFTSEELEDQGDIMAVLLTGKPLTEQTSQEGGSLMNTISTALAGFGTKLFGKYTPLDQLDIDLGEGLSSGSVEAGKAITPELFLLSRFRWGVEDERENRVEAEVQFRPRGVRRFSIEAVIGDRLAGGLQVVWRVLY
ncbi:MAG: translocation/assembly module TamB domain-containing protein [Deltaproteobacteria bacterium]|nr:translocation/assembly module TamB domain-containing protein [Deltaproteobacteria bacterium]